MTTTQKISAMILAQMTQNGGNLREAINTVLGAGTFEKLASDVYDALKAKA